MRRLIFIPLFFSAALSSAAGKPDSPSGSNSIILVENINDAGAGSLRQAILTANQQPGRDEINFLPGVTGTIKLAASLPVLTEDVILNGPGADKLTVSGENQFRILETFNNQVPVIIHLSGLTFSGGKGNAGAAIRNGGLCTVNIKNCVFIRNISPNTGAGDGGALGNFITSKMYVDKCSFFGNYANTFGGAIYNLGMLELKNSTFTGNKAFNGSAVFTINQTGKTTITNCTISGNLTEGGSGAGVFSDLLSTTTIRNSTITLNRTTGIGSGGGVFCGVTATLNISSSIIAGNTTTVNGPDIQGKIISLGFNILGNNSGNSGITHGVNNDQAGSPGALLDPMLGPLQNNGGPTLTHALLPGSPAIDAGTCNGLTLDQRGVARPYNGICDIGAFEVAPSFKANMGPLTIFLSAASPADNGKMIDIKADILIGDSIFGSYTILRKRIAGHQNQSGLRIDIPVVARAVPVNPTDSIRVRISIRGADRHGMSARLWHNTDSTSGASRGFSRMTYSIDSSTPAFLYLSENFSLTTEPGTRAVSASGAGAGGFAVLGTWSILVDRLTEQLRGRNAGRPVAQIPKTNSIDFSVIPNPSGFSPVFRFENRDAEKATLEITDASGKLITVKNIRISGPGKTIFNGIFLHQSGFYAARLTLEKGGRVIGRETTRFLVK